MKKKLLCAAGLLVLSLGMLTGCGTPSAEDLADSVVENQVESASASVKGNVEGSATVEDADVSISAECDLTVDVQNAMSKKVLAAVQGTVSYEAKSDGDKVGQDLDVEAYMDGKEGKEYYYSDDDEAWYYDEFEGSDYADSMDQMMDLSKDFIAKGEVAKKTEKIEDEDCYVVTVNPTGEDYVDFMDAAAEASDAEDDWDEAKEELEDSTDLSAEEFFDLIGGEYKFYVSKKNGYLCGMSVDLTAFDAEKFLDETDLADSMDIDIEDVEISALTLEITLKDINDTEVEIPDDVPEDAVEAGTYAFEDDDIVEDYDDDEAYEVEEEEDDAETVQLGVGDSFDMIGFGMDTPCATLYVPAGYTYDSDWSTEWTTYLNSDAVGDDITIYCEQSYPFDEMLEGGEGVDGYEFETYEADDFAGHDKVYQIYYGYEGDDNYDYMVLLFDSYMNGSDEESWVSVEIPYSIWADWTSDDVEAFLNELSGN